jgi:hypothetical protein
MKIILIFFFVNKLQMENNSLDDQADRETCAPEILYETGSISFNESEISFDCPVIDSANQFSPFSPNLNPSHRPGLSPGPLNSPIPRQSIKNSSNPFVHSIATLCLTCKSLYNPNFNPHGSCIFHKERWNSGSYTCCGSPVKNSSGCCISRHSAETRAEIETETLKLCSNCKELGHLSKLCPKDPNTRSGVDPKVELERITKLKTPKIQPKNIHGNYEVDKEGFKDIEKLKAKIKEKRSLFTTVPSSNDRCQSLSTEEAERHRLRSFK